LSRATARQQLDTGNREVFKKLAKKVNEIMVAGPGFEDLTLTQFFSELRRKQREQRKSA
jgi:hypothetical protein